MLWCSPTGLYADPFKNRAVLGARMMDETRRREMRLVNAEITLKNPRRPESDPVTLEALADTAAVHLCIPSHVQIQPQLNEIGK